MVSVCPPEAQGLEISSATGPTIQFSHAYTVNPNKNSECLQLQGASFVDNHPLMCQKGDVS